LLAVGVAGLVFRIVVARWSHGSNDINIWTHFAELIETHHGLGWLYDNQVDFNHPPLIALFLTGLHKLAHAMGWRFDSLFKLPQIGADTLAGVLVYQTWRVRGSVTASGAFALFCWNPASFLVSAHHGNTDPTVAALSLLAAFLIDRRRPFAGGLALAAAINVKLIPVLLIPVYLVSLATRREVLRFIAALALGALPFVPFVVFHWTGFRPHVLAYKSYAGPWGITSLLDFLAQTRNFVDLPRSLTGFWTKTGSAVVLLVPVVLAVANWRRERIWSACELGAIVYVAFLVLTPGFGVQYVVYPIPLLFAVDVRRACACAASTGLFILIVYYATWTGTRPYFSNFYPGFPMGSKVFGHLAWLILVFTVIRLVAKPGSGPRPAWSVGPHRGG
jgi:Gpi18-like mannosyltransferase